MTTSSHGWRTPQNFLLLISIIVPIAFSTWMALLNNFVIEKANFDGADIGLLQSVREIPGFLAFTAVFVLLFIREQRFMLVSLAMLTLGTALTGYFPTLYGLLFTTLLMSTGFHYFETLKQSLSLQCYLKKKRQKCWVSLFLLELWLLCLPTAPFGFRSNSSNLILKRSI